MTDDEHFGEWDLWLDRVRKDIENVVIGRHVYEEVEALVRENPSLHQPSSFYDLMTTTFSAWAAMAVRRQMEADSVSLARLLAAIEKRPKVISRKRFVSIYIAKIRPASMVQAAEELVPRASGAYLPGPEFFEDIANRTFDKYVAADAEHVVGSLVNAERRSLWEKAEKVQAFASKRIAHLVEQPTEIPTMDELGECVDAFENTVLRYLMLFRASAPSRLLPTWQYDWKAIFRMPWLPSVN
jgi:hypothetical protein